MLIAFFICLAFTCGYLLCGIFGKKKLQLFINLIGDNEAQIEEQFERIQKLFNEYDDVKTQVYFYKPERELEVEEDDEI